ncbi:MAG: sensor histidine kinase [Clostridiales bacterium]|nr:sensor histidine kinase [Clostridiales bacterium]
MKKKSPLTWFSAMLLQRKMMLMFSSVFLAMLLVFIMVAHISIAGNSRDQLLYSARQSFSQAQTFVSNKINLSLFVSDTVYYDINIHNLMKRALDAKMDLGDEYREVFTVWNNLKSMQSDAICNVRLYLGNQSTYAQQGLNFDSLPQLMQTEQYHQILDAQHQALWFSPQQQIRRTGTTPVRVVTYTRLIRALDDYAQVVGAVAVSLEADRLDEILHNANTVQSSQTYILNSKGEMIASSDAALLQNFQSHGELTAPIGMAMDCELLIVNGERYICLNTAVVGTDWELTTLIDANQIQLAGWTAVRLLLLCSIPILLVGLLLIYYLARSIARRVRVLSTHMEAVQSNNLNVTVPEEPADELGQLGKSFNYMLDEIRLLMHQQYENGKFLQQAELKALQAQINPHFLYNTLDLINWKAMDVGADEIAEITQIMARYYKLSLGKGLDFVSIRDELEHLTLYVRIQNFRFGGRIKMETNVPEELLDHEILKLILQPLVENAVMHGMNRGHQGLEGELRVDGSLEEGDILLHVRDNGIGITNETIAQVMQSQPTQDTKGYGLRNIHQRLRLCYGARYGLSFENGGTTTVTVRIPWHPSQIIE